METSEEKSGLRIATEFILGVIAGFLSIHLIWVGLVFLVIYPLSEIFSNGTQPIPSVLWYGSWPLALFVDGLIYMMSRHKFSVFATTFIISAAILSLPLLFFMWFGANISI